MEENVFNNNKQAALLIKNKNYQAAFALLAASLKVLKCTQESTTVQKLKSLLYSNFSVLYKETGRIKEAVLVLHKLIEIEKKINGSKANTVNAYLNLSSIYSQSGDHEMGLKFGLTGLILIQKDFPLPDSLVQNLVIAYHNVGVEYEYLNRINDAIECYSKGFDMAKSRLGLMNPLTLSIKQSLMDSRKSKKKFPDIGKVRLNSQLGSKRSEIIEKYVNTGSTSSSGADARSIGTPRQYNYKGITCKSSRNRYRIDLVIQRSNERNAAVIIQAWWRGQIDRKKIKNLKMQVDLKKAAAKARLAIEEFKALKEIAQKNKLPSIRENKFMKKQKNAANRSIDLKTLQKRSEIRRNSVEILSTRTNSDSVSVKSTNNRIPCLQSRNKLNTLSISKTLPKNFSKVLKIQSFFRMHLARKRFRLIKNSAITIQKNFRRFSCLRLYKEILNSIVKIQTEYKKYNLTKEKYSAKLKFVLSK